MVVSYNLMMSEQDILHDVEIKSKISQLRVT